MVISETKEKVTGDFPKLMISADGVIVLMKSPTYGAVVGGKDHVGRISATWDMSRFTDYHGEVTLRNE